MVPVLSIVKPWFLKVMGIDRQDSRMIRLTAECYIEDGHHHEKTQT